MHVTDPILNFKNLMNPVLQALHQMGRTSTNEALRDKVAELLNISEDQANILHDSDISNQTEFECQLAWAKSHLKKYGIINNPSRGIWIILEEKQDITSVDVKDVIRFYQKTQIAAKNKKSKRRSTGKHHYEEPPLFQNFDNNISDTNSDDDIFADSAIVSESDIEEKDKIREDLFGSHDEENELSTESSNSDRNHHNQAIKTDKEEDCINVIIEYFKKNESAETKLKYKNTLQLIVLSGDDTIELEITLDPFLGRLNIFSYLKYDPILADRLLRLFSRQDIVCTLSIDSSKLQDHYLIKKTVETEKYSYNEIINIINRVIMDISMIRSIINSG